MEGSYNGAYPDGFGHGAPGVMTGQGMMGPPIVPPPMMGAAMGQMLMPAPGEMSHTVTDCSRWRVGVCLLR